ncbi:olfactory receptor 10C1 [Neofelis nebulosa]|uniref:olfactory receptor 10C1 n=1 Tax=Neofelis nebulosa TaxID=61452 RepID=UPI00272AFB74|nr:olfactory receptor 10C1 [Neofelis nebulosa]
MGTNASLVAQFIPMGFSHLAHLQGWLFFLFLGVYLLTVANDLFIVVMVSADATLQSPMYFFLRVLSALEIGATSVTLPRRLLTGQRHVPHMGFTLHMFFFLFLRATECCLLVATAYDCYAAICKPLGYPLLLSHRVCLQLTGAAWACGAMLGLSHTSFIFSLPFCSPDASLHFRVLLALFARFSFSVALGRPLLHHSHRTQGDLAGTLQMSVQIRRYQEALLRGIRAGAEKPRVKAANSEEPSTW